MRSTHLTSANVAVLVVCAVCPASGVTSPFATAAGGEQKPRHAAKSQKLENFNCGDYTWCSGLQSTMKAVTDLTKKAEPQPNPVAAAVLEKLSPPKDEDKLLDLHTTDETQLKLDKAKEEIAASEKALYEAREEVRHDEKAEKLGTNDAAVAKWKRFAKKLTKEKMDMKAKFDDLMAENQVLHENITRISKDKEQAQEVALVIANQWRNNARQLTSANADLASNITRLTAEKQQLLGEMSKANLDKQQLSMEKQEAAIEFQRTHDTEHNTVAQWKEYADRLAADKQQLSDTIEKLSAEKNKMETTITSLNEAVPQTEDSNLVAFNSQPLQASAVVPISYVQQPGYQQA